MNTNIPIYKPTLMGNEAKYVESCLKEGWISSRGEYVAKFEHAFKDYLDGSYSTSVSNGTVALHLALYTLGIGAGDEVIVPTLTYIASVNAISYVGASPVFIDSEPDTWNIDALKIEEKITNKTKAIMAVHLYGAVCNMTLLRKICERHNLYLIEDVAEAFGSKYENAFAGTFGDISTFSFFGNKTITTGEGGMVVSKHPNLIARAANLKSQAVSLTKEYWHDELGFNYRMTNICAAIGLAQLERAEEIIVKKRDIANWYKDGLDGLPLIFQNENSGTRHTYWMVSILADCQIKRDKIRSFLSEVGIETRPLFYPANTMPMYKTNDHFPIANNISSRGLNLPSFSSLTYEQVEFICSQIRLAI